MRLESGGTQGGGALFAQCRGPRARSQPSRCHQQATKSDLKWQPQPGQEVGPGGRNKNFSLTRGGLCPSALCVARDRDQTQAS